MHKIGEALVRLGMVFFGVLVMYLEGLSQPNPGVWFVVGMGMIVAAVVPLREE